MYHMHGCLIFQRNQLQGEADPEKILTVYAGKDLAEFQWRNLRPEIHLKFVSLQKSHLYKNLEMNQDLPIHRHEHVIFCRQIDRFILVPRI